MSRDDIANRARQTPNDGLSRAERVMAKTDCGICGGLPGDDDPEAWHAYNRSMRRHLAQQRNAEAAYEHELNRRLALGQKDADARRGAALARQDFIVDTAVVEAAPPPRQGQLT